MGCRSRARCTGKDGGHGGVVEKKIDQIEKARAGEPEKKAAKKKDDEPKAEAKAEAKPEPKAESKAKPEPAADKPVTKPEHDDKAAKAEKTEKTDKPEESKARFTLQLSSFQDKSEAQAFLETVKSAGFQATLTQAEVDGKGTFYRVRMGTYRSLEAANDAKSEFEKTAKKSASVMRL